MGRVYEALKRAAEQNGAGGNGNGNGEPSSHTREEKGLAPHADTNGNGSHADAKAHAERDAKSRSVAAVADGPESEAAAAPDLFLRTSRHFQSPETAHRPAPTGHTGTPVGSALPDGSAPREAGATLGAAGSARTPEFVSIDISAARVEPHLVAITQPRSGHAERFRSLRTRVLHAGERRKMQAFVITSAGVMEGKTLTAINLSWLLAQTDGVSALLIDGDLRNPCAADYLGLEADSGLSEVLGGEATLAESIIRLEPAGLHLLPGGSARDDVAEMLSGPKFSAVLKEARRMFDYIIIDAPPLGIFTDASVLINRADSALIVARANKTKYGALEKLLEPLPRERLLGVILNGSDEQLNEQNYYYYRRRYSSRRKAEDAEDAKGGAREE
ncbi:MAG TPA: CpsD/CapB family tyrosine-protein kinase [Pyrinomonadaceae bacterium]|jgi:capsular exopolysaccharide synthesis family protein|nr:CpsD/CapB family tyrosine-protein kinase [Pyrinomonadaceae bacterium]